MLQYYFDSPELKFKLSLMEMPSLTLLSSERHIQPKIFIKNWHPMNMPKKAIYKATQMQCEIEAKGISTLPRNRMQMSNYRRVENKKNDNVPYSVMLECKLCQGTTKHFSVMLRLPLSHNAFFVFIQNSRHGTIFI